jgi:hypothetical protein
MSAPSTPQDHPGGLLFKFPTELRLKIYESMFPPDEIEVFSFRSDLIQVPNPNLVAGQYVALLATCRAIYNEAKPVLYDNTKFAVHCSWHPSIGPASASKAVQDKYKSMVWAQRPSFSDTNSDSDISMWDGSDESDHAIVEWKKFTQLKQARIIILNLNFDGDYASADAEDAWVQHMNEEISSACKLKVLHIILGVAEDGNPATAQGDLDSTMAILGELKCKVTLAAMVVPSPGSARLSLRSYHRMLERLGG